MLLRPLLVQLNTMNSTKKLIFFILNVYQNNKLSFVCFENVIRKMEIEKRAPIFHLCSCVVFESCRLRSSKTQNVRHCEVQSN